MKYNTIENTHKFISRLNLTFGECPARLQDVVEVFNRVASEIGEEDGLSLLFLYKNPAIFARVKNEIKSL